MVRQSSARGHSSPWSMNTHERPSLTKSQVGQYLGTYCARSKYFGLWCHSWRCTEKPVLMVSCARSAQGVLGWRSMTSLSNRSASAYFLAVSFRGAQGVFEWSTRHVIAVVGPSRPLGYWGRLNDRRHQSAILVGYDTQTRPSERASGRNALATASQARGRVAFSSFRADSGSRGAR